MEHGEFTRHPASERGPSVRVRRDQARFAGKPGRAVLTARPDSTGSRVTSTRAEAATSSSAAGLEAMIPFLGQNPPEASAEIAIPNVFPDDERVWVPQTDTVSFRPLCFNVSQGYYVNLLRVRKSGLLSRHRHPGPVHGFVMKGDWKYLEHEWTATQGSYVFEPPGETHTLVVLPGCEEMITLFHVTGALLYCNPEGEVTGYEDVFTKLEKAKEHYAAVGLGEDFVNQFVR